MCPFYAGNYHIVSVERHVIVISPVSALPQYRTFFNFQFYIVFQFYARKHIPPSVRVITARNHNSSASRSACSVYGKLESPCIIGKAVSFCSVVKHIEIFLRNKKIIRVIGEILPILYIERRTHRNFLFTVTESRHKARREMCHAFLIRAHERKVVYAGFRGEVFG